MVTLHALHGWHVDPERAAAVVAPPYDGLSAAERTTLAASRTSFLGALPPRPGSADLDATLAACRARLDDLLADGCFVAVEDPFLAVLELRSPDHGTARAVVGDVDAAAYLDGTILPHEHVRVDRVTELARYLDVVGVASSPVAVTHPPDPALAHLLAEVAATPPPVAFTAPDDVEVVLWVVTDERQVAAITAAVAGVGTLLVADGHHRAAAVAHARGPQGRVLTALFADGQLRVLPFHRRVEGLAEPEGALREALALRGLRLGAEVVAPAAPTEPGTVTVTVGGRWWELDLTARRGESVLERLDVRTVERELLEPLALVTDGAAQVVPVAAPLGLAALAADDAVGFALVPPTLDEVASVAAAGSVLPPKATYLVPKLRSGLLLVPR